MSENKKIATHLETREQLMQMQCLGGGMIMPFILHKVFQLLLPEETRPVEKSERIIRDSVYVYCALCNEYYVFNRHAKHPKKEFFITDARWEKYHISKETLKQCIEFLSQYDFISLEINDTIRHGAQVIVYRINLDSLLLFSRAAKELIESTLT